MNQPFQLAPGPIYQPGKPVRNPQYKRFVKGFPCIGCGGPRATSTRCTQVPRGFAERYQLDIAALIATFNAAWELKQRRTA